MDRLYTIDFDFNAPAPNSTLNFTSGVLEIFTLKRGNILGSLFNNIFKNAGHGQLSSDGLLGVVADGAPAPNSTVILLQEISGVLVEVGRVNSSDGSWAFNTLGATQTIAIAIKQGYNAGIVSELMPGVDNG